MAVLLLDGAPSGGGISLRDQGRRGSISSHTLRCATTVREPCGMMKASRASPASCGLRIFNLGGAFGNDAQLRARMAGKFKRPRRQSHTPACIFPEGWTTFRQTLVSGSPSRTCSGPAGHMFHGLLRFPEKSVLCPLLLQFFERCSFNLNLEALFPNPKSLSSLLFFFS